MNNQFQTILNQFSTQRILVLGDALLDGYFNGYSDRICREAPVPIVEVQKSEYTPGGAANVATNIAKLTGQALFLSVVGKDTNAKRLKNKLIHEGVDTQYLLSDPARETIAKNRVIADSQMLLRFDSGSTTELTGDIEDQLINQLVELWAQVEAIVISDYGYGILTESVISTIAKLQNAYPQILIIDSKYLDKYTHVKATAIKPNYQEAVALVGLTKIERGEKRVHQISEYKEELLKRTNATLAIVTLDTEGALIFDQQGSLYRTYADHIDNPNVAGAGDTYIAAVSLAFASGADVKTAVEIAANATKVIIRKKGTTYCTVEELQTAVIAKNKLISDRQLLEKLVAGAKKQGKKIVFTNGCFDILHSGHVNYLQKAKSFGDILILGVNTDESIRKLKGSQRPINTLSDRVQVLAGLSSVNYVIPMPEDTACELVDLIRPDVYVKGGDYSLETLPEASHVLKWGGKVELVSIVKGKSTTNIIKRIQDSQISSTAQTL